jgi:hypothetical protein
MEWVVETEQRFTTQALANAGVVYMQTEITPFVVAERSPFHVTNRIQPLGYWTARGVFTVSTKGNQDNLRAWINTAWQQNTPLRDALNGSWMESHDCGHDLRPENCAATIQRVVKS